MYCCSALLCVLLLLQGCTTSQSENLSQTPASTAGAFKVAILLPGAIDDLSWSQSGYTGLVQIQQELGAEVSYQTNVTETNAAQVFKEYAEQGFDLVIGHGSQYYASAEEIAQQFPRTKFAVVGDFPGNNRNLGAVSFRNGETGYLIGVVAALKSKSNKIAYIGGMENQSQQEAAKLVQRGAASINPDAVVSVQWVGSWTDSAKAADLAQKQLQAGADVLIQNADSAGIAVFEAAEQAGVFAIGWAEDQNALAPRTIVTSAIQRVPVLLLNVATLVRRGRWEGKQYTFGMKEGALDIAPFYGLLTKDEEQRVRQIQQDIVTTKIDVFR
jgi:basic membrane protein A